MTITTINPATGEMIKEYATHALHEIDQRIQLLYQGWQQWKILSFHARGQYFIAISRKLLENKEHYAQIITQEMGKPIQFARSEIEKCAWICEYFAEHAESLLQDEIIQTNLQKSFTHCQPLGVIFGIMPWNFPFWQVFRAAVTCMMAGNVFLLKHAPISTGASLAIEKLFNDVIPLTVFQSIIVQDEAASALIQHPLISGVTLTGSVRAGRAVAEQAGRHIKKCVLELGGNDPYIILADADIAMAAQRCVQSRLANAGQVCIAPKRFIVVEAIYDIFRAAVLENVENMSLQSKTLFGPMAREDLRANVHQQVLESIAKGAKKLIGGEMPTGSGFYYPPTVLENVKPGMPAFDDEIFGPVIALVCAKDEEEAIILANLSSYGLGAGVFTQNKEHGEYLAVNRIEAGACYVNGIVSSDPRLPFGGIKSSGMGYELGYIGMHEFVHIKTVGII